MRSPFNRDRAATLRDYVALVVTWLLFISMLLGAAQVLAGTVLVRDRSVPLAGASLTCRSPIASDGLWPFVGRGLV